ncbi:uncharacterized protein LMH87_008790 [Akanthomyces muscarius]|uniref:Uncharacterized protein n=1 Tax=Akanthomyces muscarius TaxID=2231603 RepID=A0A9W8UQ44_AKAMU|nr:uncharacterized protein LMH87_008790 [Akanthomyces muscarius]KAJ4158257.1 hypothetical protein LMH87_008790 [Akanthomyces muscarius]
MHIYFTLPIPEGVGVGFLSIRQFPMTPSFPWETPPTHPAPPATSYEGDEMFTAQAKGKRQSEQDLLPSLFS